MQRRNEPSGPRRHPRASGKLVAFCAIALSACAAGCVTRSVVWSECPAPNPVEAQDISEWLIEEPARPGQDWVARVIGHIYAEDLREVRGDE
jgi:hypothetical protein